MGTQVRRNIDITFVTVVAVVKAEGCEIESPVTSAHNTVKLLMKIYF